MPSGDAADSLVYNSIPFGAPVMQVRVLNRPAATPDYIFELLARGSIIPVARGGTAATTFNPMNVIISGSNNTSALTSPTKPTVPSVLRHPGTAYQSPAWEPITNIIPPSGEIPVNTTTGTASAYVLTITQLAGKTLADLTGRTIAMVLHVNNNASPTLDLNGLGAIPVMSDTPLGAQNQTWSKAALQAGSWTANGTTSVRLQRLGTTYQWIAIGTAGTLPMALGGTGSTSIAANSLVTTNSANQIVGIPNPGSPTNQVLLTKVGANPTSWTLINNGPLNTATVNRATVPNVGAVKDYVESLVPAGVQKEAFWTTYDGFLCHCRWGWVPSVESGSTDKNFIEFEMQDPSMLWIIYAGTNFLYTIDQITLDGFTRNLTPTVSRCIFTDGMGGMGFLELTASVSGLTSNIIAAYSPPTPPGIAIMNNSMKFIWTW
jgi:hypothetical protein